MITSVLEAVSPSFQRLRPSDLDYVAAKGGRVYGRTSGIWADEIGRGGVGDAIYEVVRWLGGESTPGGLLDKTAVGDDQRANRLAVR